MGLIKSPKKYQDQSKDGQSFELEKIRGGGRHRKNASSISISNLNNSKVEEAKLRREKYSKLKVKTTKSNGTPYF